LVRLKADPPYGFLKRAAKLGAVLAVCFAIPRTAAAQTARTWDVFGGYAYLRDQNEEISLHAGWAAAGARRITRWLSIVGEAGGHYKTLPLVGGDATLSAHTVLAGGRASIGVGRFVEFVQVAAGPVYTRGSAFGLTSRDTLFAVQAGLGVDAPLATGFAARLQFDVRRLRTGRELRAIAGLVWVR
jgi:hypothetical protein